MKGLSLTQPWATLIALNAKRIETRSWATSYRGLLAVHASKGFPRDCQQLCATEPFRAVLLAAGIEHTKALPVGAIVAVARLVGCTRTERIRMNVDERERAFGDYAAGRFGFFLHEVRPLISPISCKGALGLWTVPPEVCDAMAVQLRGTSDV